MNALLTSAHVALCAGSNLSHQVSTMLSASNDVEKSWILSASIVVDVHVRSRRLSQEPGFSAVLLSGSPVKKGKSAGRTIRGVGCVCDCGVVGGGDCSHDDGSDRSDDGSEESVPSDSELLCWSDIVWFVFEDQVLHLSARSSLCAVL